MKELLLLSFSSQQCAIERPTTNFINGDSTRFLSINAPVPYLNGIDHTASLIAVIGLSKN